MSVDIESYEELLNDFLTKDKEDILKRKFLGVAKNRNEEIAKEKEIRMREDAMRVMKMLQNAQYCSSQNPKPKEPTPKEKLAIGVDSMVSFLSAKKGLWLTPADVETLMIEVEQLRKEIDSLI